MYLVCRSYDSAVAALFAYRCFLRNLLNSVRLETAPTGRRKCPFIFRIHYKWTNPDGTENVGARITLQLWNVSWAEMHLAGGSIWEGNYVDPDKFNQHPIRYNFTKEAVGVMAKLLSEDGVDLGWEVAWEDQPVKINGKLLEHGKRYMIKIAVDEAWVYFTDMCECTECSWYKNHEFIITFMIIPVDAE